MDVNSYLRRLGYAAPLGPTYETLRGLQAAHMQHIPFENLDIVPLHRPIQLDEPALWDKLVVRNRGGFCYELNGLFAWLLKQAGFEVTYLNARVFRRDGSLGLDFDHLTLLVGAPGDSARWLADVGFGNSFLEPLVLQEGEQPQGLRSYRLQRSADGYISWQRDYDGIWERQYFFDLAPRTFPGDYKSTCSYHQRSPESSFTHRPIISQATSDGRVSLESDRLIITTHGARQEQPVTAEEWPRLLWDYFGVRL